MGQQHASATLYPREKPCSHFTEGWVGPRASLDMCGKSRPHRYSIPDRPAPSQSLYRLSYLRPLYIYIYIYIYILMFNPPLGITYFTNLRRSQWPRGLRLESASARLLRLRVRILLNIIQQGNCKNNETGNTSF